jgi:hypothetical protein
MTAAVLFQTMPPLSVDEYANLEQSIRDHGIQVPIIVDEDGVVIDGHHRQKIADTLGISCPVETKFGLSDTEKRNLSLSLNIDRRQISREQRRALIEESVKADPGLSDREHGRRLGVDGKTVGGVRDDLEGRAEIPHVDERTDSLGRNQPASKPMVSLHTKHIEETTETFDAVTGEAIEPGDVPDVSNLGTPSEVETPNAAPPPSREPKPVLTGEAAKKDSAERGSEALGRALVVIDGLRHRAERARRIRDWPIGFEAATPDARDLATPTAFRAMAEALNVFADEWEIANG